MKAKNKFTFVDLFAGCGGLSEGFLQSEKFEALAHVEWKKSPVKAYDKSSKYLKRFHN